MITAQFTVRAHTLMGVGALPFFFYYLRLLVLFFFFFSIPYLALFSMFTHRWHGWNLFNLLIEQARAPFQRVWVQFFPNSYTREGEKQHLNICRPQEPNPGLLCGKQVCYPLHHCLSGKRLQINGAQIINPGAKNYLLTIDLDSFNKVLEDLGSGKQGLS